MTDRRPFPRSWTDRTGPELAELAASDPVAILPLAAVEQHGPHLPVSTDLVIGRGILEAALDVLPVAFPVVVLPELAVGASLEHEGFPGTLSLEGATLEAVLLAHAASLARAGVRRWVVFNSHGGNKHVVDAAGLRARVDHGLLVVKAHSFRFPRPDGLGLPEREWTHGLHGGAVETSMMLHLRPDLVRRDALARFASLGERLEETLEVVGPEGAAPFSWAAGDLNPHGVVGDATAADARIGARLVDHYAKFLAAIVRDARAFPLAHLDSPG